MVPAPGQSIRNQRYPCYNTRDVFGPIREPVVLIQMFWNETSLFCPQPTESSGSKIALERDYHNTHILYL